MVVSHLKPNAAQRVSGSPDREFPFSEPHSAVVGLLLEYPSFDPLLLTLSCTSPFRLSFRL